MQIIMDYKIDKGASIHRDTSSNIIDQSSQPLPFESSIDRMDGPSRKLDMSQVISSNVVEDCSIYDMFSSLRCKIMVGTVSLAAFLIPLYGTIYLPALNTIRNDLNTTRALVAFTISFYLIMVGISSILWGLSADRFGRKITGIASLIILLIGSVASVFSPNIVVLIVFRIVQGGSVSAAMVLGPSVISDIYPANTRAWATGIFFVPFLVGPVVAPLIGGALTEALGWRSTFVCLSILTFVVLVMVIFLLSETHQCLTKKYFEKQNPNKRITDSISNEELTVKKACKPFILLFDLTVIPYLAVTTMAFTGLFVTLTLFPNHLEKKPYDYSETIIGLLFIPAGVAMLVGSILGGGLSDKFAKAFDYMSCLEIRLIPSMIFASLTPVGLLIYGWTIQNNVNVTGPLFGEIVIGFSRSSLVPGIIAYFTIKKQADATAAVSANTLLNYVGAGIGVATAVPLQDAMGIGPLFSLHCGINAVSVGVASIVVFMKYIEARHLISQANNVVPAPSQF